MSEYIGWDKLPANLTYIRHMVREGVPSNPRLWDSFAEMVERACDELEGFRRYDNHAARVADVEAVELLREIVDENRLSGGDKDVRDFLARLQ